MKNLKLHIVRVFGKLWYLLIIMCIISPFLCSIVFLAALIISMVFFNNFTEAKNPENYFTEEEWRKIHSGESIDNEEYLILLAKYQTYECPVKVDEITTWTSSEITKDSFICNYEINDRWHRYGEIDMNIVKGNILDQIDKKGIKVQSIIATNRNMIFRYRNYRTGTIEDVILSNEELRS